MAAAPSEETAERPSRREEILAAAARVIAERGFKDATVRDIGDAAGILSGSLYYHFDSKEEIVLDLLLPSISAQYKEASALRKSAPTETEALKLLIRTSIITTSQNPHKTVILRNNGRTFDETELLAPISKLRRQTLRLWTGVVTAGVANGEFRDDVDVPVAVHGMLDGLLGSARWFLPSSNADPEAIIDTLTRVYIAGLTHP